MASLHTSKQQRREWLRRYLPAECIATTTALAAAWYTYLHSHSYVAATAAGLVGEGIGFYGYFVSLELTANAQAYRHLPPLRRIMRATAKASANLVVEFLPAEILDNFLLRPYLMFIAPHYIHPYPVGFLVGKFSADLLFYTIAIVGYEARKRWVS